MATQYPLSNLPTPSQSWGRKVESEIETLRAEITSMQNRQGGNSATNVGTLARLSTSIQALQRAQADLQTAQSDLQTAQLDLKNQQDLLTAASRVSSNETTTQRTGFTGYYGAAALSVTVTSPTGRIEVQFGGSLNSGNGYFVFGITRNDTGATVLAREDIRTNPARRIALSGGASFTPSAYKSAVANVPANVECTVQLFYYAEQSTVYFYGGSLLVRPSL